MANASASGSLWEEHDHDAIVHSHEHYHVTHNFREMTGGFEHLSSEHEHKHDHTPVNHGHYPHQDLQHEHLGEAHVHDHVQPARVLDGDGNGQVAAADTGGSNGRKVPARRTKAAAAK